ncbi:MAG: glycosyltransferase family protein [Bacteroidales bacterium]|nr:glycosyltransferase family protein [Bacteroidales bacterium]
MKRAPKILYAILDWGIGHATRSKPVIEYLINNNCEIILAGSGRSAKYLRRVFPDLTFLDLPDYGIHYSKRGSQIPTILSQAYNIYSAFKKEHKLINNIIDTYSIDIIISDNRFGVYSKHCKSFYITHQLNFKLKGIYRAFEKTVAYVHKFVINKFDFVLIPDNDNSSIAGKISKSDKLKKKIHYLGPLSRFNYCNKDKYNISKDFVLFLLSGPEPQRSILEELLKKIIKRIDKEVIIVRGLPDGNNAEEGDGIRIIDFADESYLQSLIINAQLIVCRSGYSTIMDLWTLQKKALLVPTPGQPEQEYLAKYLNLEYGFEYLKQCDIDNYKWESMFSSSHWEHNGEANSFKKVINKLILNTID